MTPKKIKAQITIRASYDDSINIAVEDKASGIQFLDLTMTREQWINATMNQLGCTEVAVAEVRGLGDVGKTMEMKSFEFEILKPGDDKLAMAFVHMHCPEGWVPDMSFSSQDSFFDKEGKHYARITIRRWV